MESDDEALRRTAPLATLDIVPHAAYFHTGDIHTTAATRNWRWVFTAGAEGVVRKFDFFASLNNKTLLSAQQRHSLVDTLTKAAQMVNHWENDTPRNSLRTGYTVNGESRAPPTSPPIISSAVHSDGLWLLTGQKQVGSVDKTQPQEVPVKLWTVRIYEGRCMHEFRHHHASVSALALEHSEQAFVSGSWDKTIQRCDLNTGQVTRTFSAHTSHVTSVSFQPGQSSTALLLSSSLDGIAYCWDVRQSQPAKMFQLAGHGQPPWILTACWGSNGDEVYCGRRNGTVDEWSVSKGVYSHTLKLPSGAGAVTTLSAFPDRKHLFVASEDNIRIWNIADAAAAAAKGATAFQILPTHCGASVSSVCIDEQMRFMATSSGDRGLSLGIPDKATIFYEIRSGL